PGRGHRGPLRARQPRTCRPPRPHGTRWAVPQRVRPGPDRGRQAPGRVRRAARPEPGEDGGVPPHPRLRPADRRALRHSQRPGVAAGDGLDGRLLLRPGLVRAGAAVARSTPAQAPGPADLGPRGPGQPGRRRAGGDEDDPPGPAARVRRLRPLGAAGKGGRIQPARDRVPERRQHMISSLGYLRIESADPGAWREFGLKILGMTEGRGPEAGAVYLRMDEFPARLVIIPGSADHLLASGWEVADAQALAAVGRALADAGVPYKAGTDDEVAARRVGAMLTAEDPAGHTLEVFCGAALDRRPSASPYGTRFVTGDL